MMLFRIDTFSVPEDARAEFDARSVSTMSLLATQHGFVHSERFEKVSGPGSVDIVTVVAWHDLESVDAAATAVRAMHAAEGFDPSAFSRDHGIVESKAIYASKGSGIEV